MTAYTLVESRCAWCHVFPCRCPRVERCACGGWLVAVEGAEREAVAAHNATPEHREWRARR